MVLVVGESVCVPLVALAPVQPLLAEQDVALVELQVKVVEFLVVIDVGLAESVAVGVGVVALCVVTFTIVEYAERLPAASVARVRKRYVVFAVSPVFE